MPPQRRPVSRTSQARTPQPKPDLFARALAEMGRGDLAGAERHYRAHLAVHPLHAETHRHLGLIAAKRGHYAIAATLIERAIALDPTNLEALNNLGLILRHLGRNDEAVAVARRAVALEHRQGPALVALGLTLMGRNEHVAAVRAFEDAARDAPNEPDVWFKLGEALRRADRFAEAAAACRKGLMLAPDSPEGLNLHGLLCDATGHVSEALGLFERALQGGDHDAVVCANLAHIHLKQDRLEAAQRFAEQSLALNARNGGALGNLGMIFQRQGRIKEAIETYSQAIAVEPGCVRHYTNLTALMSSIGEFDTAIAASRLAITLDAANPEAQFNLAIAYRGKRQLPAAIEAYRDALDRGCDEAAVDIVHLRSQLCDWDDLAADQAHAMAKTYRLNKAVAPFSVMTASDAAADHRLCASVQARTFATPEAPLALYRPRSRGGRLRIGYLSCDFYQHATTSLIAQLFERHDRERFETFGYSYGPDDRSGMRSRIIGALDDFVDIRDLAHAEAARRIHDDAIDILVDLKGYTQGARTEILCYRPAPIQVSYLGYPGTMGGPFVDYIVSDGFVTPPAHASHFSEHVVRLPHCYQPNDRNRPVARPGSRADAGLPEQAFVFACFNNTYKLTPQFFDIWMRLLHAVPGAVFWLFQATEGVAQNLRREAVARGIAPERLVFAPRVRSEDHIARMALADLFLDTLPVNAHTTASEALWAGLPVLTCAGQAFAGRVAGSLLHAVGLPELVTNSVDDYEAAALALATDPIRLQGLRDRLAANRLTTPLFDIDRYTRDLETAFVLMGALREAGQPPEAITLTRD